MKTVQITIENGKSFTAEAGKRLTDALEEAGVYLPAPCGGVGKCGKCKIAVAAGELPVTDTDRRFLSAEELAKGHRLACAARVEGDLVIRLPESGEEHFDVLAGIGADGLDADRRGVAERSDVLAGAGADGPNTDRKCAAERFDALAGAGTDGLDADRKCVAERFDALAERASACIAIDIGTTTLAAALIDRSSGELTAAVTGVNHQRAFGADVVSRIAAASGGAGGKLQQSIRGDLNALIERLLSEGGCLPKQIGRVAISANTTMGHLLMGYPCEGLGAYPFTPWNIGTVTEKAQAVLGGETVLDCPVTLLPGISAYVGGDIAAGLLTCSFYERKRPALFLDLGTNGEMAVGNRDRILAASTAAGPAFEGGNISCGTGSIPGAICSVEIKDGKAHIATIGDVPAIGLCGTGVIETTRELLAGGLMDESGLLDEAYEKTGFPLALTPEGRTIAFTQRDVREIQLAKSAVRAGVETLLLRYGISCDEVDMVYVAGGFGFHLDMEKAVDIGLLPGELRGRVQAAGNTSLRGAANYLTRTAAPEQLAGLIGVCSEVELAMDPDFNERYMEHMMFDCSKIQFRGQ